MVRFALALCWCLSCSSGTGSSSGNGPAPGTTPLPAPAKTPATAPPASVGTPLVVVQHAADSPTARFVELDLTPTLASGAAPVRGQGFELPMLPHPWDERQFVVTASQDGADLVVGSLRGGTPILVSRTLGRSESREVQQLTGRPAAVLVSRGVAYVGAGDRVGFVDLRAPTPRFTSVHQRTLSERKAYDLLLRSGDWLVAIDDVVMPLWGDSFSLDARGLPTHRGGWELPGVINGSYQRGALLGSAGDGTMVLLAPYSIMDGHGHDLVALGLHGHALAPFPERLVLQNARGEPGAPPVLEEHVPRGRPSGPLVLHGGPAFSEWTALAVLGEGTAAQLVFAAGDRGLMVLPGAFTATTDATLVDVGGHCLDVVLRGDVLIALVGTAPPDPYAPPPVTAPPAPGPSRLVLVRREGGTLRTGATLPLDAPYTSLVH